MLTICLYVYGAFVLNKYGYGAYVHMVPICLLVMWLWCLCPYHAYGAYELRLPIYLPYRCTLAYSNNIQIL